MQRIIFHLLTLFSASWALASDFPLCSRFVLNPSRGVRFTDVELRMICGDAKEKAWANLPDNQALFNLKNFLQARGFFEPQVEVRNGVNFIDPGRLHRVEYFDWEGAPAEVDLTRLRGIVGQTLKPSVLDDASESVLRHLKRAGYPCPRVKMEAGYTTGHLLARIEPGPRLNLIGVEEDPISSVRPGTMQRYYAFQIGQLYNEELFLLTRQRILNDAVVQGTFFESGCERFNKNPGSGIVARQRFVPGPPRVVTVGVGADTEKGPILRGSWKNSRLWEGASLIQIETQLSYREQSIRNSAHWFGNKKPSRVYLRPSLDVIRKNEKSADTFEIKAQGALATSFDTQTVGGAAAVGPRLEYFRTWRGQGPPTTEFATLGVEFQLGSHNFELYANTPREGFNIRLDAELSREGWVSGFTAQVVRLTYEELWNLWHFDPPLLVAGLRGGAFVTITELDVTSDKLPDTFKQRLGGSENLRGFGRRSLPRGGTPGGLTAGYLGAELRLVDVLPLKFQPFVFADAGVAGVGSLAFDGVVYLSPGFGARWASPIGVFRSTLGRGYIVGAERKLEPPSGWQFYLSFGEEF